MFQMQASSRRRTIDQPTTHKVQRLAVDLLLALAAVAVLLALMNTGALVSFADWFGQTVAANWR